jgi:hypothetical protein
MENTSLGGLVGDEWPGCSNKGYAHLTFRPVHELEQNIVVPYACTIVCNLLIVTLDDTISNFQHYPRSWKIQTHN